MKVYGCVRKGTREGKVNCDDRILIGTTVYAEGEVETELEEPFVLAVADGVGGCSGGYMAAQSALEKWSELDEANGPEEMVKTLKAVNDFVLQKAANMPGFEDMCATFTLLKIGEEGNVIHLGDSRAYLVRTFRGMKIVRQLTMDQNVLNQQMSMEGFEESGMTEEGLKQSPNWSHIVTYIGMDSSRMESEVQVVDNLEPSGVYILTSDGVHDYVEEKEFYHIIQGEESVKEKAKMLLQRALENGSDDDQSIIIAEI